jgi:hypothetical protein
MFRRVPMTLPDPVEPAPRPTQYPDAITRGIAQAKATMWWATEAESIPGVRKALAVIVGTISGFSLSAWRGNERLDGSAFPWLAQPDPGRTSQAILSATIRDGIWFDRCVWRKVPGGFRRINPTRILEIPADDPDDPPAYAIDGVRANPDDLAVFDFAELGGLRRFGAPLLDLYARVAEAAARYADEPVPSIILKNTGADIEDDAIDRLLARWEASRQTRSTGFLNAYLDAITPGYSARDVQLVEVLEAVTKDIARLFGLPAYVLGVDSGSSMTYQNLTEQRRDLLDALRPWMTPVEQTLSLDTFTVQLTSAGVSASRRGLYVPFTTDVRFDTTDYLREGFAARIAALTAATGGPIMTVPEARELEPTISNPSGGPDAQPV